MCKHSPVLNVVGRRVVEILAFFLSIAALMYLGDSIKRGPRHHDNSQSDLQRCTVFVSAICRLCDGLSDYCGSVFWVYGQRCNEMPLHFAAKRTNRSLGQDVLVCLEIEHLEAPLRARKLDRELRSSV